MERAGQKCECYRSVIHFLLPVAKGTSWFWEYDKSVNIFILHLKWSNTSVVPVTLQVVNSVLDFYFASIGVGSMQTSTAHVQKGGNFAIEVYYLVIAALKTLLKS